MQPRHVLLASMALAALAFLRWRTFSTERPAREAVGGRAAASAALERGASAPAASSAPLAERTSAPAGITDAETTTRAQDSLGVLVYGAVLDETGARVAQGVLGFRSAEGEKREGLITLPGSYTALGLAPGRWSLSVIAAGHYPFEGELEIPAGIERFRHDVTLGRAVALRVRFVTPDGTPLAEVSEAIRRDDDLRPVAIATLDPPSVALPALNGRDAFFNGVGSWSGRSRRDSDDSIPAGFDGLLTLREPPPVHVSAVLRDVVLATQLVAPGTETVEFTLAPEELEAQLAGLRLRVVDAVTGAPIPSGRVILSHSQGGGIPRELDEQGTIEFRDRLPGLLELVVWVPSYGSVNKRVRLLPGETIDVTLALQPEVILTGRVLGPDGEGISVNMRTIPLHQLELPIDVDTRSGFESDSEGRFEARVGANETMLVVNDHGLAITPLYVDARAAVGELELRVGPATPVTLRAEGDASTVVRTVLADALGRPFYTLLFRREDVLRLGPGTYFLRIGGDESSWHEERFTVGAEPITLTFPATPR